jgi:hypothetical protein
MKPMLFGVWKRMTGRSRCPERRAAVGMYFRCMRPNGHAGVHGWEFFGVQR